jgi:hypothetical protein
MKGPIPGSGGGAGTGSLASNPIRENQVDMLMTDLVTDPQVPSHHPGRETLRKQGGAFAHEVKISTAGQVPAIFEEAGSLGIC